MSMSVNALWGMMKGVDITHLEDEDISALPMHEGQHSPSSAKRIKHVGRGLYQTGGSRASVCITGTGKCIDLSGRGCSDSR